MSAPAKSPPSSPPLVLGFAQDRDLRYTSVWNPGNGTPLGAEVGRTDEELLGPRAAYLITLKRRVLRTGRPVRRTVALDLPSGRRVIDLTLGPLHDADGRVTGVHGTSIDVTAAEGEQEASRIRASLLEEVAARIDAIVWSSSLDGRMLYLNAAVERLTGLRAQLVLDDPRLWWDRVHPEDLSRVRNAYASVLDTSGFNERFRFRHGDGTYRTFKAAGYVHRAEDGTPLRVVGVTVDVTAHDRRDSQLRSALDEASTYRRLFSSANTLAAIADFRGHFTMLSPAWHSTMGFDPRGLVGTPLLELVHPEDADAARAMLDAAVTRGQSVASVELRVRCYDGSQRWLLWNVTADADAQRLYAVAQDVSERKFNEMLVNETTTALREREEALRQTQRLAQLGGWQWDAATDQVTWSEETYRMLGVDPGERFESIGEMAPYSTAASWRDMHEAVQRTLATGEPFEIELEVVRRDGARRWSVVRGEPMLDDEGRVVRLRGTTQDVTERKLAELALRASEQRLRDMAAQVPGVIYQFRLLPDGTMEMPYLSPGLQHVFGIDPDEAYADSSRIWSHVEPAHLEGLMASIQRSAETMQPWLYDFDVVLDNGERRRVHGASQPQREADGGILWSGLLSDVTEQRAQEAALVEAREAALAASREKSLFLANMSHEIRTPMNGILGMTELALGTSLTPEQCEYLEAVRQSGETLLSLLNDILDLSKIEARRVTIEHVPFVLRQVVADAVDLLKLRAYEKGLTVSVEVDPALPDRVLGDPIRLGQIIRNFFSNAVKFTSAGGVAVHVTPDAGADLVRLSVADTGVGIDPSHQAHIFDPFMQSDSTTTRRYGGTGLGLSIARQLTELMGGSVWLDSTPGHGSTFHARIPLPAAPPDATTVSTMAPLGASGPSGPFLALGLRVLVVEDNVINARVVTRMLQKLGCQVDGADTGLAGLAAVARGGYDAVLMDVQMPEVDGLEITRRIRRRERGSGSHMPIIALTANAMKGDEQRCFEAGMDGYLAKPIAVDRLEAELRRVVPALSRAG